jgi:NADH dehydrogenase
VSYDHLVVAAGAVTSNFGLDGVAEHGYPLKSLAEALALRDHVLRQFEDAAARPSAIEDGDLAFVVAGGGPTGVETAGALAELVDHVLRRDHPDLDLSRVRIVLLEKGDRLLAALSPASSKRAFDALTDRGVEVRLGVALRSAGHDSVELDDGSTLPTSTLIWVAGVTASPIAQQLGAPTGSGGRVAVTPTLQLVDDDRVHVIGDVAAATDATGALLPQLAPVALQQGRYVAAHVVDVIDGTADDTPFHYVDKGTMATIGRNEAVAELPFGLRFGGFPAWIAWLGLHLLFLVGVRNRVAVLFSWVWNYVTYDRSARLILHVGGDDHADRRPHLDVGG